jgi:flagellar basal-body rod modification protein FlgD
MVSITSVIGPGTQTPSPDTPADTVGKQEFMRLLVMQLRNQDPLNPVNDREFISQMAQLSTLEATAGLAQQVQQLVVAQQQAGALQLVGREVEYVSAEGEVVRGRVSAVRVDSVPPLLVIGEHEVPVIWIEKVL